MVLLRSIATTTVKPIVSPRNREGRRGRILDWTEGRSEAAGGASERRRDSIANHVTIEEKVQTF